jgi:hypothetical protein
MDFFIGLIGIFLALVLLYGHRGVVGPSRTGRQFLGLDPITPEQEKPLFAITVPPEFLSNLGRRWRRQ